MAIDAGTSRSRRGDGSTARHERQYRLDPAVLLYRMPKWPAGIHFVLVATSYFSALEVAGINQVSHDSLRGSFCNSHSLGYIAQSYLRIFCD